MQWEAIAFVWSNHGSVAVCKKKMWRQDLHRDHNFINLIIFSFVATNCFFATTFYWYVFVCAWVSFTPFIPLLFCRSGWSPVFCVYFPALVSPNRYQIPQNRARTDREAAQKNRSNEMCLPATIAPIQSGWDGLLNVLLLFPSSHLIYSSSLSVGYLAGWWKCSNGNTETIDALTQPPALGMGIITLTGISCKANGSIGEFIFASSEFTFALVGGRECSKK